MAETKERFVLECKATLGGFSVDRDGEMTVKLKIPQIYYVEATKLGLLVQKVLDVRVEEEKDLFNTSGDKPPKEKKEESSVTD